MLPRLCLRFLEMSRRVDLKRLDQFTPPEFPGHSTNNIMPIAKSTRKPNTALMKPVQPDDTLAKIVGSKPLARSEVTKKIWDYIKKNKLQDAKKKTLINADDALKAVFGGKKQVTMFEMTKHVSGHLK
jgi:chromatin remodeling complex protein RSC6